MIYVYTGVSLFANLPPTPEQCLGPLPDALTCEVERDTEGLFDLTLTYPRSGLNAGFLTPGNWLYAQAGGTLGMQYFCIAAPEETEDGIITVRADHISYNARDILAAPFTAESEKNSDYVKFYPWSAKLDAAINTISPIQRGQFAVIGYTDQMELNAARYTEPVSLRQAVQDAAADRDMFVFSDGINLKLWKVPDFAAPSFVIRYGKNLMTYSNSADMDDFYTYIFPYAFTGEGNYSTYNGRIFQRKNVPPEYANVVKIRAVDFTGLYGMEEPYLDIFKICIDMWLKQYPFEAFPTTISVGAAPDESNTYELGLAGDIYYTPGDYHSRATIVSLRYDAVRDLVTEIGVGRVRRDISDTIAGLMKKGG